MTPRNGGASRGILPVRLTDIPITTRRRVGHYLIERAARDGELLASIQLRNAIERPSGRVYWLPRAAVLRVLPDWED